MKRFIYLIAAVAATLLLNGCLGGAFNLGSSAPAPTDVKVVAGDSSVTLTWTESPNVEYWVFKKDGKKVVEENPADMPNAADIEHVEEPYVKAQIVTPSDYVGNLMQLAIEKRGIYVNTTYLDPTRADLAFEFPLSEIIFDFYEITSRILRFRFLKHSLPLFLRHPIPVLPPAPRAPVPQFALAHPTAVRP